MTCGIYDKQLIPYMMYYQLIMHIYIDRYTHVCVYVYIYMYMYVYIYIYIHTHIVTYDPVTSPARCCYGRFFESSIWNYIYTYIYIYIIPWHDIYTHIYIYIYIYTHMYLSLSLYIYIYIYILEEWAQTLGHFDLSKDILS